MIEEIIQKKVDELKAKCLKTGFISVKEIEIALGEPGEEILDEVIHLFEEAGIDVVKAGSFICLKKQGLMWSKLVQTKKLQPF